MNKPLLLRGPVTAKSGRREIIVEETDTTNYPMLIFNSEKEEYKKLHEEIIQYFHFLYQKACDGLSNKELKAWFEFNEVPNNWLGYSMSGNKGSALGKQYARFLYKNIRFATNTNNITKSNHIERIMLLYEGKRKSVMRRKNVLH